MGLSPAPSTRGAVPTAGARSGDSPRLDDAPGTVPGGQRGYRKHVVRWSFTIPVACMNA
jgi:hypothetical protein